MFIWYTMPCDYTAGLVIFEFVNACVCVCVYVHACAGSSVVVMPIFII